MVLGHFTQVVWEQTVELGIAFATFQDQGWNKVMVVANYFPTGNMRGESENNVKPIKHT